MKKLFIGFGVLFTLTIFILGSQTSCKKETIREVSNTDTVYQCPASIEGLWIGTHTLSGQPDQYFSLIIKPDGSLISDTKQDTQQHFATGPWNLSGTSFTGSSTCVYGYPANIGVVLEYNGIWDNANHITGTWNNVPPIINSGTFTLTKVN